jgi:hypothetical protein
MENPMSSDAPDPIGQAAIKNFMFNLMCLMEITTFFASPRIVAKADGVPTREHVLEHLDAYLPVARKMRRGGGPDSRPVPEMATHAERLRELFSEWTPSLLDIPPEVVQESRNFLAALGVLGPEEGWDAYEGPPEDAPGPPAHEA